MFESAFSLPSLVEEERKQLLSQRKKAYSLIFLMIMLAQTSYIGALEGWSLVTELEEVQEEPLRVASPAVCAATSRSSGTAIHVDVAGGDDTYPGTTNCPKASLGAAVTLAASESASNPEIVLHAGLYHENVSVNNLDNLLIRANDGDRVVFDGTRSIANDMNATWSTADSYGIQEVTLPQDGWQLFLAYDEQVPARWPNAGFDDETVFNRSYWAEGTLTNSNNAYTKGWLTDAGPEAGVHTGLNETVNASGLDPVGAIAVLNLGSFRSNSRIITDWNPNNGTFAYDGDGVGWKTKHHAYFLEGKRELIDADGEWWYNNTNNRLHYKTPSGQDANDLDLRVKVQPFAISVGGSDGVTIQGIDFFGTTVNFNNCDGCSFTNATLEYPSTSKRGLGIAGESEDDRWMTRFYRSKNSFVDNISITNTDGGAIEFHGSGGQSHNNTVNNSYFHAIDWSAADQKGLMTTIYEGGRDVYFTNNSVHLTGASSVLSIGDAPKVFYNEVWDVGYLQTDGAVVQVMQGEAPGAEIAYNWIHDVIKYGARFDAPIGQAGEGRNGTMHHNVIWNAAGGLMVKGDYHDIHNNTVFNSTGKNDLIILTDNGVNNENSTIHQNAADKMADHRSDSWSLHPLPSGTYWNNWNGYVNTTDTVSNQLVDPINNDFRPKTNSHLDNMSAGAYDADDSDPWTAGISWTYSPMSDPISGCMDSIAINYNSNAVFSDGSCIFTTLSYSPENLTLTKGQTSTDLPLNATLTGSGAITSWAISPALPSGLSFGTSNGTIWGIPTVLQTTAVTYMIWANNSGGSSSATVNITVNDEAPVISYSTTEITGTKDVAISPHVGPTTSGGTITSWEISPDPGSAFHFNSNNGYISGTPSILLSRTQHTIWANNSGGSSVAYVNVTINDVAPGPFEYNPENNTWTNNSYVNIGPSFINETSGNGSTWQVADIQSGQSGSVPASSSYGWRIVVDDTMYFTANDGITGLELWAYNTSNGTTWQAADINSGSGSSLSLFLDVRPMVILVGETIYFSADDGSSGEELWAHNTSSHSTWRVADIRSGVGDSKPGKDMYVLIGDIIVFDANDWYNGKELWAHNTATNSTSRVTQLASGSASINAGFYMSTVVGSRVYFNGFTGTSIGTELYAYDTSNNSAWLVADINSGSGSSVPDNSVLIGDTLYFSADDGSTGDELWAHDTSNHSTWQVADINSGASSGIYWLTQLDNYPVIDGVIYFSATDGITGHELWAHSTSNGTTWQVADINSGTGSSYPADRMGLIVSGDTLYFRADDGSTGEELWAHDTSNHSTWRVTDLNSGSGDGYAWTLDVIGDTLYFIGDDGSTGDELWAYDTSNQSTWLVYDIYTGPNNSRFGDNWLKEVLVGNHLVFTADDGSTGQELWAHEPSSINYQTNTGGNVTTWAINASLPSGLSFGTNNGTIYGTPTELWTQTSYMVWANNSGGSSVAYLNITVVDELPTISYSPTNIVMTNNTVSTDLPLVPTSTGAGEITSWAINASLPAGLTFETSNGTIWGTPTALWNTTAYTIWANNSGGSSVAYLNLTVIDQLPTSVTYTPENLTLVRGEVSSDLPLAPALTGPGDITSWAINASLPTGLSFGTNNGTIWGVPQINMTTTEYTVWANNSGGSVSTTLNITILEPIVVLDYNPENLTLVRNIAMTDLHPTVTGGSVETWEIHPSIPAGLNFADGVLSGTPTVNMTLAMFTIYANTTGGSASHTINLTILEPGVIFEYNPENQTMTRGVAMITMTPTVTNGTAETWSIDPLLPSGLNFNNGVISGTPTVNMTRTTFTVWANTTGGAAFHTINLTILEPIVGLDYNPENLTLTRGVAMADLHPIVTGGNVSEWGISPIPLSGLTFAEGLLYGTPGINQTTPIMYTIYANTTGGSITHTINITVLEPLVDLFYNPENQTFIRTEQTIDWSPTVSGGIPETWAIEPALPNGLVFDNGTISGSPTVNLTTTQYTVWANNSGGTASTSINITINEPAPEIEYDPSDLVLTRGTAMTTLQPNVTGGLIETWEIEPAIPNGLSFVDGVISGTPTAIQNQTQYVVWANNSGGSLMAYLNITILDIVPEIAYTPENMTLTNDTSVVDWLPVNIGGPALTWSISPALSEGLEFNETTGHITGTPTEVMDVRTYVVTATNSGGFASTQINITVLDQVPMVAYVPDDVVLLNNSTVLTMEAISTGGIVTSWSILPDPSPGLLFDTTNGTLLGVATQVQNRTMYAITASNDVGSITVYVNVTVEDLFYNMSLGPLYLLNNSEMVALEPELIISGSTFEIEPDLPEGLFFGAENGTIWGTPTELMDLTNFTIYANSSLFNDEFVVQIGVLEDTDLDGLPNELPDDADPRRGLIEDLDDDGDGYTDLIEGDCLSNPLDGSDVPADLDGDFICNAIDDDIDGDGLNNTVETNTSAYIDANNTGTDAWDADTDGDGVCDGPIAPALPVDYCEAGPDAFPNDAAAYLDTDGDGMPDELWGESTTGLIEDLDDDNDGWSDLDEADCGPTDSKNEFDTPVDSDGDGICDFNEVLSVTYGTGDFELLQGERNVTLQPIITGMTVDIWEISPALPYGLFFGGDTMARTSNGNGTVYGVPLVPSNLTEYTVTATNLLTGTQISTTFNLSVEEDYDLDGLPNNNTRLGLLEVDFDDDGDGFNDSFELECGGDPYNRSSVPKIESDGTCYDYRSYEEPPEKDKNPFKPICFPIIFLLLAFILVVPMILTRRKQRVGVQAEHVSATPAFQSGSGTMLDPFVLKAVTIPYNTKTKTEERIRCAEMSPGYEVKVRETNVEVNKKRFGATQFGGVQDGTGVLKSNSDGLLMIQFTFDGTLEPSEFGMVYKSELILDEKTYFVWHVEAKAKKGK